MASFTFKLENEHGLHARPAGLIVQTCSGFSSKVNIEKNGQQFNAKSVLGLMKMAASKGDELTVIAEGDDETLAIEAFKGLVESNFNE